MMTIKMFRDVRQKYIALIGHSVRVMVRDRIRVRVRVSSDCGSYFYIRTPAKLFYNG